MWNRDLPQLNSLHVNKQYDFNRSKQFFNFWLKFSHPQDVKGIFCCIDLSYGRKNKRQWFVATIKQMNSISHDPKRYVDV